MTIIAIVVLALLLPPVAYDLIFSNNIRRLGLRNVVRRKGEAALVVGGSMLATALIAASLIVGDSFGLSIRDLAKDGWGPIDEIVYVEDAAQLEATQEKVDETAAAIDGTASGRFARVAVSGMGTGAAAEPRVRLFEGEIDELAAFGGDPEATGYADVGLLGPRDVVLNQRLADSLDLREGQQIQVHVGGEPLTFTVASVVESSGIAGFVEIVAAPGAVTGTLLSDEGVSNAVLVSNVGDVFAGADRTESVVEALRASLGADIEIEEVKREILDAAEEESVETKSLFGTVGGFSVAAGILLVINLFVMLAAERKTELGVLRAVGIKRGHVQRAFALEGAVYGLLAAVIGAVIGIGVGAGVVAFASSSLANDDTTISLSVVPSSVVAGAIIGFAISQLTVVLTSLRLTRVNIVRALKDLPEPASAANGRRWLIIGGMAIVAGVAGYVAAGTTPVVAMAAPAVALMGAIPWLGRVIAPRLATTICSALAMVWPALVFGVLPDVMGDPEVSLFLLQGIMLVGLATVLVAALSPVWLALADRLSGGGLASRLGLAHPLARPERTALLVSMYSLVIFTVTFMAVMNAVFTASTPTMAFQAGGGYDALVESNPTAELTAAELVARPDIERAVPIRRGVVDVLGNDGILDGYRVSYLPPDFAEVATPVLTGRATAFADDESAWAAAVSGQAGVANAGSSERWVIVPDWAPLDIGASTELVAENGDVEYVRIAGVTDLQWLVDGGILASAQLADPLVADSPVTRYYMQVADGLDSDEVVRALESDYVRRGVDGTTFMERALEEVQGQEVFLQMLQGYLGLGLLIGIAGLGVVLARAVRERRRQIGMMRAIGFSGSVMRRAFLLEAVFIGVQGVVLGIGLGLLSAWQIMAKSNAFEDNLTFDIPTAWLAGLAVLCLSASVAAAISPAIRSGRVSPAVALRH